MGLNSAGEKQNGYLRRSGLAGEENHYCWPFAIIVSL